LKGHTSRINAVCTVPVTGSRTLLATAGDDRTVRLWDPQTGTQKARLPARVRGMLGRLFTGTSGWERVLRAVCAVPVAGGRMLLASAGRDRVLRRWDPLTGATEPPLKGHTGWVNAVCTVPVTGSRTLLATAGADRTVRLWDPLTGTAERALEGHTGGVNAVCAV